MIFIDVGPWTEAIYETEKWYFAINYLSFVAFFGNHLFASLKAYNCPEVLIDHGWQV